MPEVTNPNNCETCDHKGYSVDGSDDGHCYMFREAPTEVCMQHTGRRAVTTAVGIRRGFRGPLAMAVAMSLLAGGDPNRPFVPLDLGLEGLDNDDPSQGEKQ